MSKLTFVTPPLGLDPLTEFTLEQLDGAHGLFALQSLDVPERRMFLLDPVVYVPGYHPELTGEQLATLGLASQDAAAVFVIANHRGGATTVNLLAPIIVNPATGMCSQLILEGQDWSIRAPLNAL